MGICTFTCPYKFHPFFTFPLFIILDLYERAYKLMKRTEDSTRETFDTTVDDEPGYVIRRKTKKARTERSTKARRVVDTDEDRSSSDDDTNVAAKVPSKPFFSSMCY